MSQFIKIPQTVKVMDNEPGVLALYGMVAKLLSNPAGYRAPYGGIKKQLKDFCRTGSEFEPVWKVFTTYYLKLVRVPMGENRFETFYELLHKPNSTVPAMRYLTAKEGHAYAARHGRYRQPRTKFNMINADMLIDTSLSARAKGVIVLLKRTLDLAKNKPDYTASKNEIMKKNHLTRTMLDPAWNEAKRSRFVKQERLSDEKTGLFCWGYTLTDYPCEITKQKTASKPVKKRSKSLSVQDDTIAGQTAKTAAERSAIGDIVRGNISYTDMLKFTHTAPLYYTKEDVDGYVKLMVDTICTSKSTVRVNREDLPAQTVREQLLQMNSNHILYVMNQLNQYTIEGNANGYKLTALYNAANTYSEYALGLIG